LLEFALASCPAERATCVAMTAVTNDAGEQILLLRRHRFVVDRWVWELPGVYLACYLTSL
jgi:hypothetical protein